MNKSTMMIIVAVLGYLYWKSQKKDDKDSDQASDQQPTAGAPEPDPTYGAGANPDAPPPDTEYYCRWTDKNYRTPTMADYIRAKDACRAAELRGD